MRKKKIIIFYASIGSGHLVAARSIEESLIKIDNSLIVETRDIFRRTKGNTILQEALAFVPSYIFPDIYSWIWKTGAFGWAYKLVTHIGPWQGSIMRKLINDKPDLVICTHTFPCSVVCRYKEKHSPLPLIAVPTDLFVHHFWPLKNINAFIAPNKVTKEELILRGFEKEKIHTLGIPISSKLKHYWKKEKAINRVTVIVLAGSFRVAPYYSIQSQVKRIMKFVEKNRNSSILWQFVFGANAKAIKYARIHFAGRNDVEIIDFPSNIQSMIAQSDFVFTKPGGLTVAESLSLKKPLLLLSSGAGQERANSHFVIASKIGLLLDTEEKLYEFLNELHKNSINQMNLFQKQEANFLNSAEKIAKLAYDML